MKVLRLGQSLCSSGGASAPNLDFVFTVDTTIAGTSGVGYMALTMNSTPINCDIDWGDGTSDTGVTANITHDYTATSGAGTYTITVSGTAISIYFNNGGDRLKMSNIANWGIFKMRDANKNTFKGCANMTATATDAPTIEGTDLRGLFYSCTLFNGDVSNWSTTAFTRMDRCFQSAAAFNRSVADWDISACTNFSVAFYGTEFYTDTPTSTTNLDAIYIGWAAQSFQTNRTVDFGDAHYTAGGAAAAGKAVLEAAGWTITDGGTV